MIEIELPCCGEIVHVERALPDRFECEGCGIVLELAKDEPA